MHGKVIIIFPFWIIFMWRGTDMEILKEENKKWFRKKRKNGNYY